MKQLFLFTVLSFALFSCSANKKQADAASSYTYELDRLLAVADQKVNDTITLVGYVTHTCKHSGKKCFVVGESQATSFQVFAKGEIAQFNQELEGSKLAITGVLKEYHMSQEEIDKNEANVKLLQEGGAPVEACQAELTNISDMRKWMKDHNKDYYIIYYMDGQSYKVLD